MTDHQYKLNYLVYKEGKQFVSQCLNFDVASCGDTYEEALFNIQEAVALFLEDNDNIDYLPISTVGITETYMTIT